MHLYSIEPAPHQGQPITTAWKIKLGDEQCHQFSQSQHHTNGSLQMKWPFVPSIQVPDTYKYGMSPLAALAMPLKVCKPA
jgi:hypothetical protein